MMNKFELVSEFTIVKYNFKKNHLTGNSEFTKPCIGYIKEGMGNFLYKGKTYIAEKGDLIYIAAGTKYYSVWSGNPDIEFYSIVFKFFSDTSFYDYRFQILKDFPSELFDSMYKNYQTAPMLAVSEFYMILNELYSKLTATEYTKYISISPAIKYIEANYNSDISIEFLSKLCNCSESGLYKSFRKFLGLTPITYKHNIMIQHALELLLNSDLSIEEISSKLGFSSSNYFRKVFFKITGKTPKDLRK